MIVLMFLPLLLSIFGGAAALYIAFRFVRAFERRGVDRAELEALRSQVAMLEDAVDRSTRTVERLEEGQLFTTRLLAERAGGAPGAT
jgi:hypothetical protein